MLIVVGDVDSDFRVAGIRVEVRVYEEGAVIKLHLPSGEERADHVDHVGPRNANDIRT